MIPFKPVCILLWFKVLVEFKVDERLGPGVLDDVVEVFGVVVDE
jgi:hypothetical protein